MMSRLFSIVFAVAVLTVSGATLVFAVEKQGDWDAAVVQARSDDLLDAAQRLVRQCRTSPPNYQGDLSSNSHLEFRHHVQHFRSVAADLSTAIEDGKGRARTAPMYKELLHITEELKRYAVDNPRGAWSAVEQAVLEAENALKVLGKSYES